jgi:hypothetical protein
MGDIHDADSDLRNELERDLRNLMARRVKRLDGIIISGDIAYGGQAEEFNFARGWVEKIRELVDCPKTGVMTTPGNHDVDRAAVVPDGDIDKLHELIRAAPSPQERDNIIASTLRDLAKGTRLMSPMSAYNDFAAEYGCAVSTAMPFWERDFPLGNRGILRIRGMTSTLVSGPRDHVVTHKMVYGGAQRMLMRDDHVFRVIVGHHPPSWTLEGDDVDRVFTDRAAIQLFGHKHENWYQRSRGIRVVAGAVHPERQESAWEPRYSALAVRLGDDGRLHTRVYPRRWSREETTFIPDYNSQGQDYRDHIVVPDTAI